MNNDFKTQTTELVTLFPFKGKGKVNDRLRFDTSGLSNSADYTLVYDGSAGTINWVNVDSAGVDTLYSSDGSITEDRTVTLDSAITLTIEGSGAANFSVPIASGDLTSLLSTEAAEIYLVVADSGLGQGSEIYMLPEELQINTPSLIINGMTKYVALLSSYAPSTATSGVLIPGETYTITTYVAGDDFANVADVQSGTINVTGCVFIATGTTPTDWTNGSTLDSTGNIIETVLENNIADPFTWIRSDVGEFHTDGVVFSPASTWVNATTSWNNDDASVAAGMAIGATDIYIYVVDENAASSDTFENLSIEIRQY